MEQQTKQLVKQFKRGNTKVFKQIVELHANRVSNIIYYMLGASSSDVDDIAQEVFIKVYKSLIYFREKSKFSTWLYRITVNSVLDYLRKRKRRKTVSLDQFETNIKNKITAQPEKVTDNLNNKELGEFLNALIQQLPVKYRTVVILKDIENLSYKDIAKTIRCSIGTVESRLFRARQILKSKITKNSTWRKLL